MDNKEPVSSAVDEREDLKLFAEWKAYPIPELNTEGRFDKDYLNREFIAFKAGIAALSRQQVAPPVEDETFVETQSRPDILEKLMYHKYEMDDLTLDDALDYMADKGWKRVRGRSDRQMVMQILYLLAAWPVNAQPVQTAGVPEGWKLVPPCQHSFHYFGDYPVRRCNNCNELETVTPQPVAQEEQKPVAWISKFHDLLSSYAGACVTTSIRNRTGEEPFNYYDADAARKSLVAHVFNFPPSVQAYNEGLEAAAMACDGLQFEVDSGTDWHDPSGCAAAIRALKKKEGV